MMTARVERPSRVPLSKPVNSAAITIAAADHQQTIARIVLAEQIITVPVIGACTNCTSRPKTSVTSWPMTMPSPQVARIASSGRP